MISYSSRQTTCSNIIYAAFKKKRIVLSFNASIHIDYYWIM